MDRRAVWPDVRAPWILHEDGALIAIDKPSGVASQAVDPAVPDDLPARLARFLHARDGRPAYVGIHQRLDRDSSGVILYTLDRAANPGLARQLEGRTAQKEYVAAVTGYRGPRERTLRHRLARGKEGRMEVVPARDRRGKEAVTHLRVIEREADRALLSVRIETGRTHQIRAQLAAEGWPVAGDPIYGGAPAARLMLHSRRIALEHPVSGRPFEAVAPVPPELADFVARGAGDPTADRARLDRALALAVERRFALGRAEGTTAFRLVNEEGDGLPGVAVDVYGDHLVAHFSSIGGLAPPDGPRGENPPVAGEPRGEELILDALYELGFDGVYVKRHPKVASRVVETRREELAPAQPLRGAPAPDELVVYEHGVPYLVRLGDGLSTGLFLDQRENRRRVAELAAGAEVLNLFAYTCAFTIAAARGGARRTVSVDASAAALARGEAGLAAAGVRGDHELVRADVFDALEGFSRAGRRFDLVIADPPTFATTKRSRWASGGDWVKLAAAALRAVAPGGRLLACSNDRRLTSRRFRRHLHDAARETGRTVVQMKDLPPPPDFPAPPGAEPHPLSTLVTVE